MEEVTIIGAGVSGLSCLNALLDRNISPLLLEANKIATPKICGEFLAPSAVKLLSQWEIKNIQAIHEIIFTCNNKMLEVKFPNTAGAIARDEVEQQLFARALKHQARIREQSAIVNIIPAINDHAYILQLASGEEIKTKQVIFASGKLNQSHKPTHFPYVGIKLHIDVIAKANTLFMYSEKNAYFGLVPISDKRSNFACLVKRDEIKKFGKTESYFDYLIQKNKYLQSTFNNALIEKINWMDGLTPAFHLKNIPHWPNTWWIGDAIVTLPPASGSGFAHGIQSGVMAAEYYLQKQGLHFQNHLENKVKTKLFYGRLLHHIFLNPRLGAIVLPVMKNNSSLVKWFLQKLDYTSLS